MGNVGNKTAIPCNDDHRNGQKYRTSEKCTKNGRKNCSRELLQRKRIRRKFKNSLSRLGYVPTPCLFVAFCEKDIFFYSTHCSAFLSMSGLLRQKQKPRSAIAVPTNLKVNLPLKSSRTGSRTFPIGVCVLILCAEGLPLRVEEITAPPMIDAPADQLAAIDQHDVCVVEPAYAREPQVFPSANIDCALVLQTALQAEFKTDTAALTSLLQGLYEEESGPNRRHTTAVTKVLSLSLSLS